MKTDRHSHYDMIVVWVEDPKNRLVQYCNGYKPEWLDLKPNEVIWGDEATYRWKPPVDSNGNELIVGKAYAFNGGVLVPDRFFEETGVWRCRVGASFGDPRGVLRELLPWELNGVKPVEDKSCKTCAYCQGKKVTKLWYSNPPKNEEYICAYFSNSPSPGWATDISEWGVVDVFLVENCPSHKNKTT
ncbi:MAG TPA: hypothetical protein PLA71_00940 [Saccharofermentans sp.]|nr:hypothetical protein [Saccharofermentans sp.]